MIAFKRLAGKDGRFYNCKTDDSWDLAAAGMFIDIFGDDGFHSDSPDRTKILLETNIIKVFFFNKAAEMMKGLLSRILVILLVITLVIAYVLVLDKVDLISSPPVPSQQIGQLKIGWEELAPYHYEVKNAGVTYHLGLDAELLTEAFARLGYNLVYEEKSWQDQLNLLRAGELDLAPLAIETSEREEYATFSDPYFLLRYAVFYRLNSGWKPPQKLDDLGDLIASRNLRIGVTEDYAYPTGLQALIAHYETKGQVIKTNSEIATLNFLVRGRVDLIFADEVEGTHLLQSLDPDTTIVHEVLDIPSQPVHIMFGLHLPPELVKDFNNTLEEMNADGSVARIIRSHYYPALLNTLEESFFFRQVELIAALFAAIAGLLMAHKQKFGIVGGFVLASSTALGGVLLRDVTAGRMPNAIVQDPETVLAIILLTLFGFVFFRLVDRWPSSWLAKSVEELEIDNHPLTLFFDTLGLATFTVVGVVIAMDMQLEPLWLWGPILAAVTNGGGAIIRDVVISNGKMTILTDVFYVEHSLFWAFLLSLFLTWYSLHPPFQQEVLHAALIITLGGVCLTRWATIYFRIGSLRY